MPSRLVDSQGNLIQPVEPEKAKEVLEEADPALVKAAFDFQYEKTRLWSEQLSLHIKPCPRWCPGVVYRWAVRLVLTQKAQKQVNPEALTRRRNFKMFGDRAGRP